MQQVSTYILERRMGGDSVVARNQERLRLRSLLESWLNSKGARELTESSGVFRSLSKGARAEYVWESVEDQDRTLDFLSLSEETPDEVVFETRVSITKTEDTVFVYATLATGHASNSLTPIYPDPRCPRFIHELLELSGDWHHGRSKLLGLQRLAAAEAGAWLGDEIWRLDRSVPIVVVSEVDGEVVLEELSDRLARDLAALANVYRISEESAWGLTKARGKEWSCYNGAVRLYWPPRPDAESPYRHPLWTADRLLSRGADSRPVFLRQIRGLVFRASVLGVQRPNIIDEIRQAPTIRRIKSLQQVAESEQMHRELAELLDVELKQFKDRNAELERLVYQLRAHVSELEWALAGRENATEDIPPVDLDGTQTPPPRSDEVRFYKKLFSTPNYDVLTLVADCGHNRWQPATKADKARKGILRLEDQTEFSSMWHCGTCTGGGMWRVKW